MKLRIALVVAAASLTGVVFPAHARIDAPACLLMSPPVNTNSPLLDRACYSQSASLNSIGWHFVAVPTTPDGGCWTLISRSNNGEISKGCVGGSATTPYVSPIIGLGEPLVHMEIDGNLLLQLNVD